MIITTPTTFKHNGITLTVDGSVQLHLSGKSVGVFEAFYNSTKVLKKKTLFVFDYIYILIFNIHIACYTS